MDYLQKRFQRAEFPIEELEMPVEAVLFVAHLAHEAGAPVMLNPAPAQPLPTQLLACVDILVPNQTELFRLAGEALEGKPLEQLAENLFGAREQAIVATLGADDALVVTENSKSGLPHIGWRLLILLVQAIRSWERWPAILPRRMTFMRR